MLKSISPIFYIIFFLVGGIVACNSTALLTPTKDNLPISTDTPASSVAFTPKLAVTTTTTPISTPFITPTSTQPATPNLAIVPTTEDELVDWLSYAWKTQIELENVIPILEQGNWINSDEINYYDLPETYPYWRSTDLTGDGIDEWIISIFSAEPSVVRCHQYKGQLWIINQDGQVYQLSSDSDAWSVPFVVEMVDLTGDGILDVITQSLNCLGVNHKSFIYHVLSGHHGQVQNIIHSENQLMQASTQLRPDIYIGYSKDWSTDGIAVIASDKEEIQLKDTDKVLALIIQRGLPPSLGSGPIRNFLETWTWDGNEIVLTNIQPEGEVEARIHVLFEANFAFALGDIEIANAKYLRVILDEKLTDSFKYDKIETYDDARQFAGFRLVLLNLKTNNFAEAINWQDWLHNEYSDQPLTKAADLLIDSWQDTNDLVQSCKVVKEFLKQYSHPTGALFNTGFGNPSLTSEEVCSLPD